MRSTNCLKIKELQKNVNNIRNICILAHVDHGKTTLADALIASNGIISNRLAGKLRYMDSREDEQIRGITMKSSGIALHYCHADDQTDYLINLIDSPGHVDFSSEVCTAVRLCDGAIIVVDVVEGVCPQTHAVLRQAWLEKLKPVLVLNKIDRLITELQCTPLEAHIHLQQVLEQVNAITAGLYSADVLEKTAQNADTKTNTKEASMEENMVFDWASGLDDTDDSSLYFCPHQGNVIFASATDGWGFRIQQFARIFSAKLGIRENALCKTLWGDYYVNQKAKKILKGAQLKAKKPLFVQFILENLWALYDAVLTRKNHERTTKITESLNLKISARDVRVGKSEPKAYLHTICSQWLPLSNAVLASVCEQLPSPCSILEERVEGLMCGPTKSFSSLPPQTQAIKQDFMECDASSDTIIVLVSKMVAVDRKHLPQNRQRMLTSDELRERREAARLRHSEREKQQKQETLHLKAEPQCDEDSNSSSIPKPADNPEHPAEPDQSEEFIAFARVFSGTVRIGQRLFVLGPKFDPSKVDPNQSDTELVAANSHISVAEVKSIYNWMGRELEESDAASAGSIVGIGGLEDHVLNTATLCSTTACPSFNALLKDSAPILRVAVEPKLLSEMGSLVEGLKRLNQADPCVQVMVQDTGEHVIIAAGEVHLQRCLDDLRQRFCKIELDASKPIVPFRETIIMRPKFDVMNELIGTQQKNMLQKWCAEESSNKDSNEGDGANEGAGNSNAATKQQRGDDKKNHKLGAVTVQTPNKQCTLRIRAVPLPSEVTKLLEENSHLLQVITSLEKGTKDAVFQRRRRLESTGSTSSSRGIGQQEKAEDDVAVDDDAANDDDDESDIFAAVRRQLHVNAAAIERLRQLRADLSSAFDRAGRKWAQASDRLWSFGPRGNGPNALLNHVADYPRPSVWSALGGAAEADAGAYREFDHSVVSGFQLAALSGPLCDEPLHGVCFVVERWDNVVDDVVDDVSTGGSGDPVTAEERAPTAVTFDVPEAHDPAISSRQAERHDYGPISGQLISTTKEACKRAFQAQPQRLMAAMYTCDVQATADVLGKVYAVIGRREGRVVSEDLRDGTNVFNVVAVLPVAESFGFADEIRKRTSGLASPQLVFSHWEVVASDPFWVPTTEEEVQHFGEKADFENQACKYMNSVRRRKGLFVEEKTVEHAEKQRTLTRNK